mmetsp:Transcript_24389/g.59714  ORF Transcript_24389/g.59714 Transcript_24389/m.59714 type:complete len:81 (+) Transcript_24389:17-259(+)
MILIFPNYINMVSCVIYLGFKSVCNDVAWQGAHSLWVSSGPSSSASRISQSATRKVRTSMHKHTMMNWASETVANASIPS